MISGITFFALFHLFSMNTKAMLYFNKFTNVLLAVLLIKKKGAL
jgi:hypothetical protein